MPFSTCTNPILHLFYPPPPPQKKKKKKKNCRDIVLDFSWDIFLPGEIANNDYVQFFFFLGGGGGREVKRGVIWNLCK